MEESAENAYYRVDSSSREGVEAFPPLAIDYLLFQCLGLSVEDWVVKNPNPEDQIFDV